MSNIVTKKLSVDKNNIEQYCDAQNVSFNVSDHAWRKWLNGSTDGYVILKSDGKAVLYPTDTARPFKADSLISASRSAGTCTVDLQFAGTNVHSESYTSGTQKQKSKTDITDSAVTNSTKATEIKWHVYGKNGDNQRGDLIELTLYFYQYAMSANKGAVANGIQSASVSSATPYYGDSVTFTPVLVQGATWHGWYSDEACTNLISADQNYTVAPTSDLILYANATIDTTLYNCAAVAGTEITSVSVSDYIVPEGGECTFSAQVNEGCSFEAWYSDDTYSTVVSSSNPYTATIIENTTLYAKAHRNSLNMSVGSAEHGIATVSATTVPYGSDVTFTFTPEDEAWKLYGWYSDSELTQLVSEANPYTFTATENVTLYPKVDKKRYKITFGAQRDIVNGRIINIDAIAVYYDQLTREEKACLRTGSFNEIDNNKIINRASVQGNAGVSDVLEDIYCPCDAYVSFYAHNVTILNVPYCFMFRRAKGDYLSYWPYYWYQPTGDANIYVIGMSAEEFCNCSAVAKDGIIDAYATTPTFQEKEAIFEAELSPGYTFLGWYSDEACTKLVSAANPASVTTPGYTTDRASQTYLTLYAKATKTIYTIDVGTAEHCTTSASATTAQYGDSVTFNCVVDEGYEFKGWYSDEGLTQLVSESAEYVHSVIGDVTLWPKVEIGKYTISISITGQNAVGVKVASIDYNALTEIEIGYLKTGDYDNITPNKIYAMDSANCEVSLSENTATASIQCPRGEYVAMYVVGLKIINTVYYGYVENYTWWPYYWYQPTQDASFTAGLNANTQLGECDCVAVAKDGILSTDVTTPIVATKEALFSAEVDTGYKFAGWYSDESCAQLVSTDNPASIVTPQEAWSGLYRPNSTLTLYAKAMSLTSTIGMSLKRNNSWINAKSVYKKVNGTWVQQDNPKTLFSGSSTGNESNYIYCGDISS